MADQQQAVQRLKDLVAATHKGLEVAEGYGEQANLLVNKCKSACERLELAYTKLDLISNEITKQLHVISHVIMQLKKRNNDLYHQIEKLQITAQEVDVGLSDIFKKLMEKQVDPNLVAPSGDGGGGGVKTLHDFVDGAAVDTLRAQAFQELDKMKSLQQMGERTILEMEDSYSQLANASKGQIVRQDIIRPTYGADKMALQRNEANIIAALLLDIATHHDRVQNASRGKVHIDIVGLEGRTSGLSTQLSRMQDSLSRMASNAAEVEGRLPRTAATYKGAANILQNLERFGEDLNAKLQYFQQIDNNSRAHSASIHFLQEELANLVTWYGLFHTAYHELLYEIDRRHKYMKSQQDILDAYTRELKLMWQTESQKRNNFFEYHGRYLPPSLCPHIMEQATRFQIYPDHLATNLPALSVPISSSPVNTSNNSPSNSANVAYSLERLQILGDPPT